MYYVHDINLYHLLKLGINFILIVQHFEDFFLVTKIKQFNWSLAWLGALIGLFQVKLEQVHYNIQNLMYCNHSIGKSKLCTSKFCKILCKFVLFSCIIIQNEKNKYFFFFLFLPCGTFGSVFCLALDRAGNITISRKKVM